MDPFKQSYRNWFIAGLGIMVATAIFSSGFYLFDEHFQVLEFCNYKMGLSPAGALAWEYHEMIRPGLQPLIAYSFAKIFNVAGIYNPFILAMTLRLVMAVAGWWAISRLVILLLPSLQSRSTQKAFLFFSFFTWYVPFITVRFSAESFSATLFYFALATLLLAGNDKQVKNTSLLLAGFLLGLAWFARIQLGLAFIGIGIWMLINKWPLRYWVLLFFSFSAAVSVCVLADYWLYGKWVFTPYRYFAVNFLEGKAASFGVSPWWGYLELYTMNIIPPVSIVLLLFFFRGLWKQPAHLFGLICITFLLGHFAVGHKELRFLIPVGFPFLYFVSLGFDTWYLKIASTKFFKVTLKVLAVANLLLLTYKAFTPAQSSVKLYKYLYHQAQDAPVTLYCVNESPYTRVTLESNFYKHKNLDVRIIDSMPQLRGEVNSLKQRKAYFYSPKKMNDSITSQYHLQRVYSSLPDWVLSFNFNNWQERSNIATVYKNVAE